MECPKELAHPEKRVKIQRFTSPESARISAFTDLFEGLGTDYSGFTLNFKLQPTNFIANEREESAVRWCTPDMLSYA